jgi:hypothetical protein
MTRQVNPESSAYSQMDIDSAAVEDLMRSFTVFDPVLSKYPSRLLDRMRTECPIGYSRCSTGTGSSRSTSTCVRS